MITFGIGTTALSTIISTTTDDVSTLNDEIFTITYSISYNILYSKIRFNMIRAHCLLYLEGIKDRYMAVDAAYFSIRLAAMRSLTQKYIQVACLIRFSPGNTSVQFAAMCEEVSIKERIALLEGRKMAPVLGVPPPPPPAPHMGPDGLILPRKPYNPYLSSTNHKDLRRELLFNQKVGKNVLNQKSELQRALEKQREAASRREAERNREENYKDDPRTALQRAIEQRAKHIEMTLEQSQPTEPPSNLLITARAKLRPRADSQ